MINAWVQVFALVQRLAGVDAVEPATVFGVVEVPLQRAKQRRGTFFGSPGPARRSGWQTRTTAAHRPWRGSAVGARLEKERAEYSK